MIKSMEINNNENTTNILQKYYKLHARIYNLTRWLFLFGRREIIKKIDEAKSPKKILEIGCGTGYNLTMLRQCYPDSKIIGIDISAEMLNVADRKLGNTVELIQKPYQKPLNADSFDVIVCSYVLTMIPEFKRILDNIWLDLKPDGVITVVDFHSTPHMWFKKWMAFNHVCLEAQLLPVLEERFDTVRKETPAAYMGLWIYLMFVGRKKIRKNCPEILFKNSINSHRFLSGKSGKETEENSTK